MPRRTTRRNARIRSVALDFTDEQLKAIDITRLGEDACIVAGPGSGKTTVLVERYRQLVASGVEPSEILAITFTEKAAANMRRRLSKEFAGDAQMLRKLERAYVSTIHGFCGGLLKENATAAGVNPEFTVLDEQLAVLEQDRALRETLDDLFIDKPEAMRRLLAATAGIDLEDLLPNIYDGMRAAGLRPHELEAYPPIERPHLEGMVAAAKRYIGGFPANRNAAQQTARETAQEWLDRMLAARSPQDRLPLLGQKKAFNLQVTNSAKADIQKMREEAEVLGGALLDEMFASEKRLLIDILHRFDMRYRDRKSELVKLDFNDLEYFTVQLLAGNSELRERLHEQFRLVMIDEFQDTSEQQSDLVSLLRGPGRFYAVGDLNQSIYSFRHANPEVFQLYRKTVADARGHIQELVGNWRSREPILQATQLILNRAEGIVQRDLVPSRAFPARDLPCIEVMACEPDDDDGETYTVEAQWLANRILELWETLRISEDGGEAERAVRLSDFAILVRNSGVLQPFLDALSRAGIDYNRNRRSGFFETTEARDLAHLLRMIANPRDERSTLAVLRSDFAGISDEGLLRLKLDSRNFADALFRAEEIPLGEEDRSRLQRFLAHFWKWRSLASQIPVDRLVLRALDAMGIAWDPQSPRGANIEKFLGLARTYASMTLGEFVVHLDAMRAANPREPDAPIDETRDAVQIMTVHAAKGLEFPIVILAAMDKGVEGGRSPALNFTPEYGLGVKWSAVDGDEGISGAVHDRNKKRIKRTEDEEANRLLYVALTRAQEHLILSWTQKPSKEPENWARTVSQRLNAAAARAGSGPIEREYDAPDGRPFRVRLLRAAVPPPVLGFGGGGARGSVISALEKPAIAAQYEPNTTATALSLFASCPRKYYLSSFLGWDGALVRPGFRERASGSSSRAADIGTQVHALLAGTPPEITDLEANRLAQTFERSALGKRSYKASRRETEWDFIFGLDDWIIRGTIDLWFEDALGLTLIDYKTDDVTREQVADRARDYELQLQVYALAVEKATGKPVRQAWLHFLRPDVAVSISVGETTSQLQQITARFREAQEMRDFPLHVGTHCRRCEFFRNLCPARL